MTHAAARRPIYLDHNATTPVDRRVLDAMLPYLTEAFGNPSSRSHAFGWEADEAVKIAREQVAELIRTDPSEIIFTSGATEALALALKGAAHAYASRGRHLVTTTTEHKAVLDTCKSLQREGFDVTLVDVGSDGLVDPAAVGRAVRDDTILAAVIWANNETGTIQPIDEIATEVREKGALFLTDATQAVGKIPVSVENVDLLACSAHKFYGPKGAGALYVRRRNPRVRLIPLQEGGGQERGLRGGTLNVPAIVGMGRAAELARDEMPAEGERVSRLRDELERRLLSEIAGAAVNGSTEYRLPNTTNLRIAGVRAADLMTSAREVAFSSSSACSSGSGKPSHVLRALGLSNEEAACSIRIGLGRFTTRAEVDAAARHLVIASGAGS